MLINRFLITGLGLSSFVAGGAALGLNLNSGDNFRSSINSSRFKEELYKDEFRAFCRRKLAILAKADGTIEEECNRIKEFINKEEGYVSV